MVAIGIGQRTKGTYRRLFNDKMLFGSWLGHGGDRSLSSGPFYLKGTVMLNYFVLPGGVGEWLIPPDCKSGARKGFVGSNPAPSTIK